MPGLVFPALEGRRQGEVRSTSREMRWDMSQAPEGMKLRPSCMWEVSGSMGMGSRMGFLTGEGARQ